MAKTSPLVDSSFNPLAMYWFGLYLLVLLINNDQHISVPNWLAIFTVDNISPSNAFCMILPYVGRWHLSGWAFGAEPVVLSRGPKKAQGDANFKAQPTDGGWVVEVPTLRPGIIMYCIYIYMCVCVL